MFHLEGVELEETTDVHSDNDEPLVIRRLCRQSSSISGGSQDEGLSNSYSASTTSAEDMRDSSSMNKEHISESATMINFQRPNALSIPYSLPMPQKNGQSPKTKSKTGHGKRTKSRPTTISASSFSELYYLTGEHLGRGAYATVETCVHRISGVEYAVKIIEKRPENSRHRVIKEIETFHLCTGHSNIVQLVEYFEEDDKFFLIFEKMRGGPLLNHIQRRICFTEYEACLVVRDIANALKYLHDRGIAHRDLKPENILCTHPDVVSPVKLCDLDLASKMSMNMPTKITTPELQSPVGSAEFMAPEVVDAFVGEALSYDKRCDLWSLGVILYIMLCGYPPFYGECDREDCGWDCGLACQDCQDSLFSRIQKGDYDFPGEDWSQISGWAKDLIQHLLVKDASRRYTVDDVIHHPWLQKQPPKTPLMTPDVLLRNDSARDLKQMAGNFAAMNRLAWHQRLSSRGFMAEEDEPQMMFVAPVTVAPITVVAPNPLNRKMTPVEQFKDMTIFQNSRLAQKEQ